MNARITSFEEAEKDIRFIRDTVFWGEQKVPREIDWDGRDPLCVHVVATGDGAGVVGVGRIQPDGRIGRLAVLKQWRGRGIGAKMLSVLIESARSRGLQKVYLHAQLHAAAFYEKNAFKKDGAEFVEAGILHVNMTRDLHPV